MSLRPTQSSRGHDAGSHSAAQTASVPGVTAAGAVAQGPHVSAPSSGGQASGNKGPGASGAPAAAGSSAGGGSRKREWPRAQVVFLAVVGGADASAARPQGEKAESQAVSPLKVLSVGVGSGKEGAAVFVCVCYERSLVPVVCGVYFPSTSLRRAVLGRLNAERPPVRALGV